jgi:hypothetical protein
MQRLNMSSLTPSELSSCAIAIVEVTNSPISSQSVQDWVEGVRTCDWDAVNALVMSLCPNVETFDIVSFVHNRLIDETYLFRCLMGLQSMKGLKSLSLNSDSAWDVVLYIRQTTKTKKFGESTNRQTSGNDSFPVLEMRGSRSRAENMRLPSS